MRNPWFLTCGLATLVACGGSTSDTVDSAIAIDSAGSAATHVDGQVNGRPFDAKDAIWAQFSHTNGFNFIGSVAFSEITDYASGCSLAGQNTAPTDSRILDLGVAINDSAGHSTVPSGPGTFTVYPSTLPASANVAQVYYGSGCGKAVAYSGKSGTVTITQVRTDGGFEGTFDVIISCTGFSSCTGPDAHLTGAFTSVACPALNVNVTATCS